MNPAQTNHLPNRHLWRSWLVWSGVVLLVIGFVAERSWDALPLPRMLETFVLGAAALAVAALIRLILRCSLATASLLVFAIALPCFVGVLPMLSALLVAAAGLSLGCLLANDSARGAIASVAGIGLLAGLIGWLLPFPVHNRIVYFLLLALLCILGRAHYYTALQKGLIAWRPATRESPKIAAFAVVVVGLASTGCWLPTVQYDDLAYHLGLPSQLAALGYYRMDVHSQIWALAPWSGDIVQAMTQVLAGEEARGAVNALWLLASAALTWQLAAVLDAPIFARWLSVALFASQPLTASLVGGMQAELPAAAAGLALALAVASAPAAASLRHLLLFAALAGFLLALKTGFVALILPLCAWLTWRWRGQWSWRLVIAAIASALVVCGSSYVYAGLLTGNPLFPLFNRFFQSPLLQSDLADPRWNASAGWDWLWQLTFHTHLYLEGWDGAAGFSLLGLSGAAIVALVSPRLRAIAATGLFAFVAALLTVHYFRYTYPALVLLTIVSVVAVAAITSQRKATLLLSALAILNLSYQACSYWTLHVGGVKRTLIQWDGESVTTRLMPERALIHDIRQRDAAATVLLCSPDSPFAAELAGRGFVTAWYDPELRNAREAADADPSGAGWRSLFVRTGAGYAIASMTQSTGLTVALGDAQMLRQIGATQLWKLPHLPANGDALVRERNLALARFRP